MSQITRSQNKEATDSTKKTFTIQNDLYPDNTLYSDISVDYDNINELEKQVMKKTQNLDDSFRSLLHNLERLYVEYQINRVQLSVYQDAQYKHQNKYGRMQLDHTLYSVNHANTAVKTLKKAHDQIVENMPIFVMSNLKSPPSTDTDK